MLFGSRARGDNDASSDYDFLVIVDDTVTLKDRRLLAKKIRELFAKKLIGVDILIRTKSEIKEYQKRIWSPVRNALKEGVVL